MNKPEKAKQKGFGTVKPLIPINKGSGNPTGILFLRVLSTLSHFLVGRLLTRMELAWGLCAQERERSWRRQRTGTVEEKKVLARLQRRAPF